MPKPNLEVASRPRPSWISERVDGLGLVGSRDLKTGKCIFPCIPDESPSAPRYAAVSLSRRGVVYSFTVIHPNPKTGEKPFTLVYVDFPEGARAFGRLDLDAGVRAQIGMHVNVRVETNSSGTRYDFSAATEQAQ
ncbi:putative OB-fold protein [Nitrobacteraceae bacterium AZCC 2161]